MTNKKFKMAAMSLALTACVAASPLAANAEAPETASDANPSAAVQHESAPEEAATEDTAADALPDAPEEADAPQPAFQPAETDATVLPACVEVPAVTPEEAPADKQEETLDVPSDTEADGSAAPEEEPTAQPAEDIAVLPAQPQEKPVAVQLPAEDSGSGSEEESSTVPTAAEEPADESAEPSVDAAEPAAQPAFQPAAALDTAAGAAVEAPYGISTLMPGADNMRAVSRGTAMIDGNENVIYGSFDDAVNAAECGATITIDRDVTSDGMILTDKNLTIAGVSKTVTENGTEKKVKPKLTFTNGITIRNAELILKNLDVDMPGISSTPNVADGQIWMGICLAKDSTLTLDNTDLTMDGTGCEPVYVPDEDGVLKKRVPQGIYMDAQGGSASLNVLNGSHLTINNYDNAIASDGAVGNNAGSIYEINIKNGSSFCADGNEAGIVGLESLTVTVDKSEMHITNCTRRHGVEGRSGINGANLYITDSTVDVSGNADGYGIYATDLSVKNSTLTANNNGYSGIRITGKGQFSNANVTVTGTLNKGKAALELARVWNEQRTGVLTGSLEVIDSILNVSGNQAVGIRCNKNTVLDIDDRSRVTIKNNHATNDNGWNDMPDLAGGLLIFGGASAKLGANTTINNNRADAVGDDIVIQPGGSLTFSVRNGTGNGDLLDSCADAIDGWYLDGRGQRWDFHGDQEFVQNLLRSDVLLVDNGDGTYTLIVAADAAEGLALKAAHAEVPAPAPDPVGPTPDDPTPTPPEENTPILPEDLVLPPVQDARFDADVPVLPDDPVLPAVQDAHALPQTGTSLFAALAMALSGFALMTAGAFASLPGRNARH